MIEDAFLRALNPIFCPAFKSILKFNKNVEQMFSFSFALFPFPCGEIKMEAAQQWSFFGFKNCTDYLIGCGIAIEAFISDRHSQIASHIKNVMSNITHHFDLWHLKKSRIQISLCRIFQTCTCSFTEF